MQTRGWKDRVGPDLTVLCGGLRHSHGAYNGNDDESWQVFVAHKVGHGPRAMHPHRRLDRDMTSSFHPPTHHVSCVTRRWHATSQVVQFCSEVSYTTIYQTNSLAIDMIREMNKLEDHSIHLCIRSDIIWSKLKVPR